ncbi:MAG: RNA polymerase sigma-54 factor RpoN [uncultured Thiotrichaceae bacterium]|uniref:RNA polymerase sigma-54 factor n=1 Tax=uncultured Thiotrichaceae bacterium TaxID=298394 RepID=A0A6S6TD87_9GAMM|nr:MAG: RNA polymerase sigma-54 factor RpoN [uncultured Thiotrichaceae bacterium]
MLRQGLEVRIGQSLSMTPQLQQAIRLLQLSSIELQEEVQQALEENPLLQLAEDDYSPEGNSEKNTQETEPVTESTPGEVTTPEPDSMDSEIPADMNIDADWSDVYDTRPASSSTDSDPDSQGFLENQSGSGSEDLQTHLLWQVNMSNLSSIDKNIAETIIQSLDGAGYLYESLEDILASLDQNLLIEIEDVQAVLTFVQHLDPVGIAARNLGECLLLQLEQIKPQTSLHLKAIKLVNLQLDLLEKRNYKEIKKRLKIDQKILEDIISLLRTLQPKPGNAFSDATNDYIVPDVYVHKIQGKWVATLNAKVTPAIEVNQLYADMAGQAKSRADKLYFKENLQQARWLIRSIDSRNTTILNVARTIVEYQSAFMHYGEQAMKPLILRDIAEELEMHESTISRVTSNKYIHTPQGIFELKYFFSSQLETDAGASCSSTAIRAMIKQLISGENSNSPLSDSKLTLMLKEQGINVARRTVAKYREALSIPSSHERKTLVTS